MERASTEATDGASRSEATDGASSSESAEGESTRLWMVERTYARDEQNIVVTYATPDGERYVREHRSQRVVLDPVTAAVDASPNRLEAVEGAERLERYAAEAARMADEHAPDDEG